MKTDQEIKDWIDEREVFCKKELIIFMFNKNNGGRLHNKRFIGFWDYVLETKDWGKLKKYIRHKNFGSNGAKKGDKYYRKKFKKFEEVYKSDKRLAEMGCVRTSNFLNAFYNLELNPATIIKYKKELQCILKSN